MDKPMLNSNFNDDNVMKSIKMADIIGYNKMIKATERGYTLENIEEMIRGKKDKKGGLISISIDGSDCITYESMASAFKRTGIPTSTLAQHKNKANVEHPIIRLRAGSIYVIRFEGYEDLNVEKGLKSLVDR